MHKILALQHSFEHGPLSQRSEVLPLSQCTLYIVYYNISECPVYTPRAQTAPTRGVTRSASILAVTRSAARAKRQMMASSFSSQSSTSLSFGQSSSTNTSVPDVPLSVSALMPANCSQTPDVAAMRKISALEDELSKLREQIAMIVINQEHAGEE